MTEATAMKVEDASSKLLEKLQVTNPELAEKAKNSPKFTNAICKHLQTGVTYEAIVAGKLLKASEPDDEELQYLADLLADIPADKVLGFLIVAACVDLYQATPSQPRALIFSYPMVDQTIHQELLARSKNIVQAGGLPEV